jgi:cytoskeleton protein RodZ
VRAYAEYLGVDGDEAARRFKREALGFDGRPDLSLPLPIAERSIPGGRILMTALVLAVCGYGFWYYVGSGERRHPEMVAAVPPALRTDNATPSEAKAAVNDRAKPGVTVPRTAADRTAALATPGPGSAAALPPQVAPPSPQQVAAVDVGPQGGPPPDASHGAPPGHIYGDLTGRVRIEFRFTGDCWIQVKGGGPDADIGKLMHSGDVFRVPDHPGLVARVGDSDAMMIVLDGKVVTLPKGNSLVRNINLDPKELAAWAGAPAPALQDMLVAPPPAAANLARAPVPVSAAAPKAATVPPKLN